jgi:hypothetical protein
MSNLRQKRESLNNFFLIHFGGTRNTSLNVSFSISVVAKYQIQNRDFSKCQFVPKMTKKS